MKFEKEIHPAGAAGYRLVLRYDDGYQEGYVQTKREIPWWFRTLKKFVLEAKRRDR